MDAVHITDKNFEEEVLKSQVPVLVDFWAEWCAPCRMIIPIIAEIAKEFTGRLKVAKLNVDEAQELAMKYNIMSIPTLMIFKGGEVVDQAVGVLSKDQLVSRINYEYHLCRANSIWAELEFSSFVANEIFNSLFQSVTQGL